MDLVLGTVLLVMLCPLMLLVAAAILLVDGRPVMFNQLRPGRYGTPFTCRKFRTMRAPRAGENPWTTDAVRVTRLGGWLRRTSLDELPQLAQVVTGRLSLVGPRPLLMEYLPKYSPYHRRRHDVRPGITGLAQVSGRRALPLSQRLDLDVAYVENRSMLLDLTILARTLVQPFRGREAAGPSLDAVDDLNFHAARS
jgi:sugar transferase EpsL